MRKLELKPDGFECTLAECQPGLFLYKDEVCFKSEYTKDDGTPEAFCDSGESFWAGCTTTKQLREVKVQPLVFEWTEE